MSTTVPGPVPAVPASEEAQREVVDLCAELIRFDTSNPTSDERACADWVVSRLAEAGIASELVESAPGRANVVARIPGTDPARGALLVHGHLDAYRPTRPSGGCRRSPARSGTATCGAAAPST
ncbi:hypothetical protein SVIOM342S_08933 [Streptomyces violaceorubidus]